MEPRHAKTYERTIPANGDHGGPLCCIVAKYEDGTQISFGHEVMNKYVPADLVREVVVQGTDLVDMLDKLIHPAFVGYAKIEEFRNALMNITSNSRGMSDSHSRRTGGAMKPDNCTSLTCQGPCEGCMTSHAVYKGSGRDQRGRFWRWEFRPYLGPIFVTGKGEPMKRQPGEKSAAWNVFEKWQKAREGRG